MKKDFGGFLLTFVGVGLMLLLEGSYVLPYAFAFVGLGITSSTLEGKMSQGVGIGLATLGLLTTIAVAAGKLMSTTP